MQLPPAVEGEPDIIEPKKISLVKVDSLSEVHEAITRKRETKGRYREILSRPKQQEDDGEEVVL